MKKTIMLAAVVGSLGCFQALRVAAAESGKTTPVNVQEQNAGMVQAEADDVKPRFDVLLDQKGKQLAKTSGLVHVTGCVEVRNGNPVLVVEEFSKEVTKSSFGVFGRKTYVDETRGWAGLEPSHNAYVFHVERIKKKATLRFWASGDIGTDASGQVVMKGPNGQERVIYLWKPSDFTVAANTVSSYKELKPITCDISPFAQQPGEYRFAFNWGGSPVGLTILRVELVVP